MYRVKKYLEILRLTNSFMTGIGIVFALLLYSRWRIDTVLIAIGFATGFLGTSSAMVINDVIDKEVDSINKPWKPLVRGDINPLTAKIMSILLLIIAITINIFVGVEALITAAIYGFLGYIYSFMRKYWWSQFIVAITTTTPTIYGYVLAGMPGEYMVLAIMFSLTIFTAMLGREIVKALEDIEGDMKYGYSTIPIKHGIDTACKTVLVLGVTAPILGIITGILASTTIYYYILISITGTIYLIYMYKAYKNIYNKKILEETRKKTLVSMMIGLIAFLLSKI